MASEIKGGGQEMAVMVVDGKILITKFSSICVASSQLH